MKKTKLKQSDLINDVLPLSVRAANTLANLGVIDVKQLRQLTELDILRCKNAGRKTLNEIKRELAVYGETLKSDARTDPPTPFVKIQKWTEQIARLEKLTAGLREELASNNAELQRMRKYRRMYERLWEQLCRLQKLAVGRLGQIFRQEERDLLVAARVFRLMEEEGTYLIAQAAADKDFEHMNRNVGLRVSSDDN